MNATMQGAIGMSPKTNGLDVSMQMSLGQQPSNLLAGGRKITDAVKQAAINANNSLSKKDLTVNGQAPIGTFSSAQNSTSKAGGLTVAHLSGGQNSHRGGQVTSAQKQTLANGIIGKRHDSMSLMKALQSGPGDNSSYQNAPIKKVA